MKNLWKTIKILFFFLLTTSVAIADDWDEPANPLLFNVNSSPSEFQEPSGLSDTDNKTFKLKGLIGTSINGMLDESCGGFCITGFCAHLRWGISLFNGLYFYTIFSPKIESTLPDFLISSYNNVGEEPLKEWRNTYGKIIKTANTSIVGGLLGITDGLQGGISTSKNQKNRQNMAFKEVDIIGHPLTLLPGLINEGSPPSLGGYQVPSSGYLPNFNDTADTPTVTLSNATKEELETEGFSIDLDKFQIPTYNELKEKIQIPSLSDVRNNIQNTVSEAMQSMDIMEQVEEIKSAAQTIKNIKEIVNTALVVGETTVRGSGIGNFASPRFLAPRLFCPTEIKPFQPYYSSFLDSFWWRSGYPLTDGPVSGSNKSSIILNPVSLDTLPKVSNAVDTLKKEVWGNLYPRDGSINQSHDAKTASVLAWRGMDVLRTEVRTGKRVGVALSNNAAGKWQMIYPEVKSCRSDPYYPSPSELEEALKTSSAGGYAWNYYRTYTCCSNTSGSYLATISIPKFCINLGDVLSGIEEDRDAYNDWVNLDDGAY